MQGVAAFEKVSFDFEECRGAEFLLEHAFEENQNIFTTVFKLEKPIVAVGAPAHAWFGEVGTQLRTDVVFPKNGDVANAYGAAIAEGKKG